MMTSEILKQIITDEQSGLEMKIGGLDALEKRDLDLLKEFMRSHMSVRPIFDIMETTKVIIENNRVIVKFKSIKIGPVSVPNGYIVIPDKYVNYWINKYGISVN